jgi:hypothetical protein
MRACRTTDDRLFDFVDGIDPDLESHVGSCDHCQEFLAELWIGELTTDLSQPVLRQIRFDEFLRELGQLTVDVATAFGRAIVTYGPAGDEDVGRPPSMDSDTATSNLRDTADDEE